jgi:hypothetical protein
MLALICRDGALEEVPRDLAHLPCIRQRGETKRAPVRTRLTRAERRFVARLASGPGRRRAQSVTRSVMRLEWVEQIERLDAHRIAGPSSRSAPPWIRGVEVRLFLPAGERLGQRHLDAVQMWLADRWPQDWR